MCHNFLIDGKVMLNVRKFAGNTECCSMYLQWLSPSTDQGYFLGQTIGELCLQRRVYSYIHSEMTYPSGVDSQGESSYFSLVNTREKEEARSCSKIILNRAWREVVQRKPTVINTTLTLRWTLIQFGLFLYQSSFLPGKR